MESFTSSPRSPLVDTPVCDSDEEVFFGPVTSKELQKASQLKRRTQFLFPAFNWEPRISSLARDIGSSTNDKGSSTKAIGTSTDKTELSLSADSLESESFVTLSDKRTGSSKGDYCSALSGNSLDTNSQTSLNEAVMYSKLSNDNLETRQHHVERLSQDSLEMDSEANLKVTSKYSNISDDSLEEKSKCGLNVARFHSESSKELTNDSNQSLEQPKFCTDNLYDSSKVSNNTNSGSESSVIYDTHQYFNTAQLCSESSLSRADSSAKSAGATVVTYEVLPDIGENNTYTVENDSCEIVDLVDPSQSSIDLPKEVSVDKDGGFLSILSEAALFHASQVKDNVCDQSHANAMKDQSACSAESLEDKFKLFGIDADNLEEQQLTNSIMYVTGRDSNAFCSGRESNTYYTGRGSVSDFSHNSGIKTQKIGNLEDDSCSSEPLNEEDIQITSNTYGRQRSLMNTLYPSEVLNVQAFDPTSDSSFQDTICQETSSHQKVDPDSLNENESLNQSVENCSEVSGVCELDIATGNHTNNSSQFCEDGNQSHNDSGASSYVGEMNDTLEEYEMMMRYGVDYILGRKGNHKEKNEKDFSNNSPDLSTNQKFGRDQDGYNSDGSSLYTEATVNGPAKYHPSSASPSVFQQNSSISSAEFQDAVDLSPNCRRPANAHLKDLSEQKVLSPVRQAPLNTPTKAARDNRLATPKGNGHKNTPSGLSKLPRVASVTPSRMHSPSSHSSKQFAWTGTPSSGVKSSLFKKPITPVIPPSRIPKTPKSNQKVLENIQSPVGAYIHNTPLPILVTNIKAKTTDKAPFEKEMHARAVWRAGEMKSCIPRPGASQVKNSENINPNIGCGLPAVKYTRAPCVKLDEATKLLVPKGGEKITKLLDAPSPQVIKHEGRLRVNCGSPQLAARMQSMADALDDSLVDIHSMSGDISVCISKHASRTDTLGHRS